mmetsp:Transcript_20711/g.45017  ORF Transcript_20711/g.45017 Transcript_20711/m.45017 type:complete len:207 (-) Transcript_20711:64-684(-)
MYAASKRLCYERAGAEPSPPRSAPRSRKTRHAMQCEEGGGRLLLGAHRRVRAVGCIGGRMVVGVVLVASAGLLERVRLDGLLGVRLGGERLGGEGLGGGGRRRLLGVARLALHLGRHLVARGGRRRRCVDGALGLGGADCPRPASLHLLARLAWALLVSAVLAFPVRLHDAAQLSLVATDAGCPHTLALHGKLHATELLVGGREHH